MDRLISYLVTLCVAAALAFAWDRHPPIGFTIPIPIWRPHVGLPDSLATQRDKAWAEAVAAGKALATCHANVGALSGAVAAQNAAVDQLAKDGAARLQASAQAAQSARAVAESYRQRAAGVLAAQATGDRCAAADALILKETAR